MVFSIYAPKIFFAVFLYSFFCSLNSLAHEIVEKYEIHVPQKIVDSSGGFYSGFGSGLEFSQKLPNGDLEFFVITDRGPNCSIDDNKFVALYPEFVPKIMRITLTPQGAVHCHDYIDIDKDANVSAEEAFDGSDFSPVGKNLKPFKGRMCIDTESMAIVDDDTFVIGDEYGPYIYFIDRKTGKSKKILKPGDGLPSIFKNRSGNRGIEALTIAPNGKIYTALEGPLNIDGKTQDTAKLIRFAEIDLKNNATRMFAYQFNSEDYVNSGVVKIGDMSAIDNENFLIIEQGKKKDGTMQNLIYKINITNASDISNMKLKNGQELEYANDLKDLTHVNFIKKELLINPRGYGWNQEKMEGVSFINNRKIAITNDNDFGILGCKKEEYQCKNKSDTCYKAVPVLDKNIGKINLWVFNFSEDI